MCVCLLGCANRLPCVAQPAFELIVDAFHGLEDHHSPMFQRRDAILQSAARVKTCVMLLDLECNDLIEDMFTNFFSSARSGISHPLLFPVPLAFSSQELEKSMGH